MQFTVREGRQEVLRDILQASQKSVTVSPGKVTGQQELHTTALLLFSARVSV